MISSQNLGALYRRQGKYEAAETLEDCAMRSSSSKHPLDMNRLRNTRRPNESNLDIKYVHTTFPPQSIPSKPTDNTIYLRYRVICGFLRYFL